MAGTESRPESGTKLTPPPTQTVYLCRHRGEVPWIGVSPGLLTTCVFLYHFLLRFTGSCDLHSLWLEVWAQGHGQLSCLGLILKVPPSGSLNSGQRRPVVTTDAEDSGLLFTAELCLLQIATNEWWGADLACQPAEYPEPSHNALP